MEKKYSLVTKLHRKQIREYVINTGSSSEPDNSLIDNEHNNSVIANIELRKEWLFADI